MIVYGFAVTVLLALMVAGVAELVGDAITRLLWAASDDV